MTEPSAWRLVRRLARPAGLPAADRISPHSLRHTAITAALNGRTGRFGCYGSVTDPKVASRRTVHLPVQAVAELRSGLLAHPGLPTAPILTTATGECLRAHYVQRAWQGARRTVGLNLVVFHDLRHAVLTLTAQLGTTQAELMRPAAHSSTRAAAIYQHAAKSRDRDLAALMGSSKGASRRTERCLEHCEVNEDP